MTNEGGCTHNVEKRCRDCTAEVLALTFDKHITFTKNWSNDPEDTEPYVEFILYECYICNALTREPLLHLIWHRDTGVDLT